MSARLTSGLRVNALIRRVNLAGGSAMVLAKGDDGAGAILVVTLARGQAAQAWERGYDDAGRPALVPTGPGGDDSAVTGYWQRRRERDRDLWVVELDIADGERFAAETILAD